MLGMIRENREFLFQILWTDEATFNSDGRVNLNNTHYWSAENPHWLREVQRPGRWRVNVWCSILGGRIIGLYFFKQSLNSKVYLDFLANQLPSLLEDVPLETRHNLFLQLDSCPVHFAINVREHIVCSISTAVDWKRTFVSMTSAITRLDLPRFLFMGAVKRHRVSNSTYDQIRYEKPDS